MTYFNKYQMAQNNFAYGWLYFDENARNKVYDYCSKSLSSWKLTKANFSVAFSFSFGTQSSNNYKY